MNTFPGDYVEHNIPLILLSGLGAEDVDAQPQDPQARRLLFEGGFKIKTEIPSLTGSTAEALLSAFSSSDARDRRWNARTITRQGGTPPFRVQLVGRTYTLPPRKAAAPAGFSGFGQRFQDSLDPTLHSPLSPLTPSSPIFPDGILTPLWLAKHQHYLPSAFLTILPFTADPNLSTLRDNQLKSEINNIRSVFTSANYKIRVVVVLVCDQEETPVDLDDRLAGVRRATSLDGKNSLYFTPPGASPSEIEDFVRTILTSLQTSSQDYYRDLTRHARKKRSRGSVPPPTAPPTTGTSKTLPQPGWIVRYEFKLAVFSEFRQEMERACENYQKAYEALFGQEVVEIITGWSPRFNEARMLADAIAIRIIRCQFWSDQTTSAVRTWASHRSRIQDLVDRKDRGTENYGWQAWEAIWSRTMAQLIERADIAALNLADPVDPLLRKAGSVFAYPEKAIPMGERTRPWELLHHGGYWYDRARRHTQNRRELASQIPEEDWQARNHSEDIYLAPGPSAEFEFNYAPLVIGDLESAIQQFERRHQHRAVEKLQLEVGLERMRKGMWTESLSILRPLWKILSWRQAGWWRLVEEVGWALRECARRGGDSETLVQVDWELYSKTFSARPGWQYDFHKTLHGMQAMHPKAAVVFKAEDVLSPLVPSFAFGSFDGNVGEPMRSQLVIKSTAQQGSAPLTLSEIKIVFEGSLRPIRILGEESSALSTVDQIIGVNLRDSSMSADSSSLQSPTSGLASLVGLADLCFSPGQTKVFELTSIPREAGDVKISSITLLIDQEDFSLAYVQNNSTSPAGIWYNRGSKGLTGTKIGLDRVVSESKILPKPPKMLIRIPDLRDTYYTDEQVTLDISLVNGEAENAVVDVEARVFGQSGPPLKLTWLDHDAEPSQVGQLDTVASPAGDRTLPKRSIGEMAPSARSVLKLSITETWEPLDYELEISAIYFLPGMEEPEHKTITIDVSFVRAFEATHDFMPRFNPSSWPDFFHVENADESSSEEDGKAVTKADGLLQKWCLSSKTVSFATEALTIEGVSLSLQGIAGGAVCTWSSEQHGCLGEAEIAPEEVRESDFIFELQKLSPEDRRQVLLDLNLDIRWRRSDAGSTAFTSSLVVPRFTVAMAEPRVLATFEASKKIKSLIHLDYILENPSMHFLTFNLTMEPSEDFAFSGPKMTNLSLVPLSRQTVRYNILASKRGTWIQPSLLVVDAYFNQRLRVQATEGMRMDKKGILVWIDYEG